MNVVLLLWRTRLRATWRTSLALVVLLGLGGAVALSVAAGARRTASANDAILEATNASDINFNHGPDPAKIDALVRPLDGVEDANSWVGFNAAPPGQGAAGSFIVIGFWQDPVSVSRPVITAGRMPTAANEAMVNESWATTFRVQPGDRLEMALLDYQFSDGTPPVSLDIVGLGLLTDEVIEDELASKPLVLVPRAFTERHLDRGVWGKTRLDLAPGTDAGPIVAALVAQDLFVDEVLGEDRARVQTALRPLLVTLAGLAALAAAATVLVAGQALTRLLRRRRADDRSLQAMGCTTRQLVAVDLLYAALVTGAGAALAAGVAVAVSPLFPVGPVRRAGQNRGVDVDLTVLVCGGAVLVLAVVALVGLGSWRRRTSSRPVSPGRVPGILAARPAPATGLRLGTAQRGVAVTLAGTAGGLAILVASLTFTGSLGRLIADPALVGLSWDVGGITAYDPIDVAGLRDLLADDPTVERVTGLGYSAGEINGTTVSLAILDAVKGSPWPPLVAGRLPAVKEEVLVGRATLDQLGLELGSTLTVAIPLEGDGVEEGSTVSRTYRVVGSAVAPAIGLAGSDTPKLGTGVLVSSEALDFPPDALYSDNVLFDLAEAADPAGLRARFTRGLPNEGGSPTEWFTSATPAEVSQAGGARRVIGLGVAALAVAVVGAVVHTLLGSVRQRRREYAVLRALGFTRAQVRTTVLWQSGALVVLALAFAVPVGVAAGRWLRTAFAEDLGIVAAPAVPLLLLAGGVLTTILLVQAAALLPASLARRTPLASTLRSE